MNKAVMVVGAVAIAGASAAVGWFGVKYLLAPDEGNSAAEAPSSATVPLTFDLSKVTEEGGDLFEPPACGETWTAEATRGNHVLPIVEVTSDEAGASAKVAFTSDLEGVTAFLAQEGNVIVTRDDVVVTPNWGTEFAPELFITTEDVDAAPGAQLQMSGASLCDVAGELDAILGDFDWENATEDEIAAQYEKAAEFEEANQALPAGEYKVYAWSPIIMGEQAAVARKLAEEGITDLALLQYTAGYSPLADAPEIQPYCQENETPDGGTELLCDVPQDVLMGLLERDVPESYIVDNEPTVAISEAFTFTVS